MLRASLLLVLFILSSSATFSQSKKLNKDELAIKSVIENESKYFWARDYKNWKKQYINKPYVVWTSSTRDGVTRYDGWEAWSQQVQSLFEESPEPMLYDGIVSKTNYRFRIYKKGAWVSFIQENNGVKTYETRIMEKSQGKWKIAMVQLVYDADESTNTADSNTENN